MSEKNEKQTSELSMDELDNVAGGGTEAVAATTNVVMGPPPVVGTPPITNNPPVSGTSGEPLGIHGVGIGLGKKP